MKKIVQRVITEKKVTATFVLHDDVNQNEFKEWVKSCPFSPEGAQTVQWENIERTIDEEIEVPDEKIEGEKVETSEDSQK